MSNSVAPLPSGVGVAVIAEHRARQEQMPRHEDEHPAGGEDPHDHEARGERPRHDAPAPAEEEPPVPAETLFAATLLANALTNRAPSPAELELMGRQGWMPPHSAFRLKDKLI